MPRITPLIHRDAAACIGCRLCEVACHARDLGQPTAGRLEEPVVPRLRAVRRGAAVELAFCAHCEEPACLPACPEGALVYRDGTVSVDAAKCQGCPHCLAACPFGTIRIAPNAPARKCDLCLTRPGGPTCVEACPESALARVEPGRDRKEKNLAAALALRAAGTGRQAAGAGIRPAAGNADDRTHKHAGEL